MARARGKEEREARGERGRVNENLNLLSKISC